MMRPPLLRRVGGGRNARGAWEALLGWLKAAAFLAGRRELGVAAAAFALLHGG